MLVNNYNVTITDDRIEINYRILESTQAITPVNVLGVPTMNPLRRWSLSIISSVDRVASQFENHDALVDSILKEMQEARGRARGQLTRVHNDGEAMRTRAQELEKNAALWKDRAQRVATTDQQRGIECVKRYKKLTQEAQHVRKQEQEHSKVEQQLRKDLEAIDERLKTLKAQRNVLRTREARSEALRLGHATDTHLISDVDEIFARWESHVARYEFDTSIEPVVDELSESFVGDEERKELEAILATIKEESETNVKTNN